MMKLTDVLYRYSKINYFKDHFMFQNCLLRNYLNF